MTPKVERTTAIQVGEVELHWLSRWLCEQQRENGVASGTCRSPVKGEGRDRARWCVSCQAREQLKPVTW